MIKIFRQAKRAIYMEFDEDGNDNLIKMFRQIRDGKEFILNAELDMAVIKFKRSPIKVYEIIVENDNEVDGSVILLQNGKVMWKMDNEYVGMGLERFQECKEKGVFFPAEFIYIQVPKNKDLDYMYCDFINDN